MESITSPGWIEICFWTECNMPARTCASRSAGAPLNAISIALGPGVRTSLAGLELVIFELAPRLIESHPAATGLAAMLLGRVDFLGRGKPHQNGRAECRETGGPYGCPTAVSRILTK